ncbi:MAG: molybdopterin-guanine dinucleotide biosynthesis protein B [Dehalococcoidia bacterium]|nr:molybdopterin-guanine dinucleotide biosynthesis protein B [Dehalococcoidia bacterium]
MIPALAIVGKSGSGKTTVIEKLIAELKARGYRVAAVKHSHQAVELDREGKDTWRFTRAGSDASVISSPSRLIVIRNANKDPTIEEALMSLGESYDIAIFEGFKRGRLPKIEVHRSDLGKDLVCTPEELTAIITDEDLSPSVPAFKFSDIKAIVDFIQNEIIDRECQDISIFANGKQVFMKDFVKDIISSAILAMLSSLKNTGIIKNAVISIRNKSVSPLFGKVEKYD